MKRVAVGATIALFLAAIAALVAGRMLGGGRAGHASARAAEGAVGARIDYRPPGWRTRTINRLVSWLATVGLTPADTVTIAVPGRRSGQPRRVVLTWVVDAGNRYFVSLRGEAEWVRNVRAAGAAAIVRHGRRRPVRLTEVPSERRAPVLKAYLSKRALSKTPTMSARQYFGMEPNPSLEALERVAARYPVFLIEPTG